jgi:Tfp pilus assembly protein PilO
MLENLLNRLDARQQKLIAASAVVLLAAALFSYTLMPQVRAYRLASETKTLLEAAGLQGDLVALQLQGLSTDVEALKKLLHGDMANLPEQQLEAFVIGRLQSISWRDNVELVSIEPKDGETVQMFSELLFNVALTGTYADLYTWLTDIKAELGFIVIKEYRMRPIEDVAENPQLAASLTIASYRLDAS